MDERLEVLKEINERQRREEERLAAEAKKKQTARTVALIFFAIPAVVFFGTCVLLINDMSSPEQLAKAAEEKRCGSKYNAFSYSRQLVRNQLRSPSTAEFPWDNAEGVQVEALECGKFKVHAYVDAMNGFGAILRQEYTALMYHDAKDDSWRGKAVLHEE